MFSADVSRTESALSAESKYIETIDTQLLIHKARRFKYFFTYKMFNNNNSYTIIYLFDIDV